MTVPEFEAEIRGEIENKMPASTSAIEAEAWVTICRACFIAGLNEGGKIAIDIVAKTMAPITADERAWLCTAIFEATEPPK